MQGISKETTGGTDASTVEFVAKNRFAWPGGYAMGIMDSEGTVLCGACVAKRKDSILSDIAEGYMRGIVAFYADADDDGYGPGGTDYTGADDDTHPTTCEECGRCVTDGTDAQ